MLAVLLLVLALPDPRLTPGAVRPLSTVTVCSTQWGLDARHVTASMKAYVYGAYHIRPENRSLYVIDHLIPREIAGADDLRNLWPQPKAQAKVKDVQENALHKSVCSGGMSLSHAQDDMRQWGRR